MKIAILLGCLFLMVSGCRRDQPDTDLQNQNIYIIQNQRTTLALVIRKHQPHVECTINGKKAFMLIDTGSTGVSLYRDKIDRFGVKVIGMTKNKVSTAGGALKFEIGDELTLTFNDSLSARIEHLSIVPHSSGSADGIIGAGFLEKLHGVIDFPSKAVTLGGDSGTPNHSLKATDEATP
jgi:hypothetical protein